MNQKSVIFVIIGSFQIKIVNRSQILKFYILNIAKGYYKNDKESLRHNAKGKYRHLSEVEKNKKREYGRYTHHNISKQKNQKLKEYQKNYSEGKKSQFRGQ